MRKDFLEHLIMRKRGEINSKEIFEDLEKIEEELERVTTYNNHAYDDDHNVIYSQYEYYKKITQSARKQFDMCRLLSELKRMDSG